MQEMPTFTNTSSKTNTPPAMANDDVELVDIGAGGAAPELGQEQQVATASADNRPQAQLEEVCGPKLSSNVFVPDTSAITLPSVVIDSDSEVSCAETFDSHCILDMVVLSQLLEPHRYRILHETPPEQIEAHVSKEIIMAQLSPADEEEERLLEETMSKVLFVQLQQKGVTLKSLLSFDLDGYPMLSKQSFFELRQLSKKTVVSKAEVHHVLAHDAHFAADPDALEENVESFFKFEKDTITGNCLGEILRKLDREANKIRFSREFLANMVSIQRSMATFFPFLVVFITTLVLLASTELWNQYAGLLNGSTPTEPWRNYCKNGVTGECFFHRKTLDEGGTFLEISEFVENDVVEDLWKYAPENGTASSVPFNGYWLLGGLVVRVSPWVDYQSAGLKPCSDLNLSQSILEVRLGHYWDCRSWFHVVIPFNSTKEEALTHMHSLELNTPVFDDAAIIIQYAMLNPATGGISWVTTVLSVPQYGGLITKFHTQVIDDALDPVILVCMVMSIILFVFDCIVAFLFRSIKHGRASVVVNILSRLLMLVIIVAAYIVSRLKPTISSVYQATHVIRGIDAAAANAETSQLLFGLWILVFFAVFIQYLAYIPGLHMIVKLVRILLPDVFALFAFFASIYIMFVNIGMMLFGSTNVTYSSFVNANASMLQYFLLHFDLENLMENYPQSGFAFYYIFRIFVTYIMLNFFIVTIIAPIRTVWLEGDLPIVLNLVLAGTKKTLFESLWFQLETSLIIASELIFNSVVSNVKHYIKFHRLVEGLYVPETPLGVRLQCCNDLLDIRNTKDVDPLFSERAVTIETTRVGCFDASYFLCRLAIQTESNIVYLRDGRLLTLIRVYDEFQTRIERDFEIKKSEDEEVFPPNEEIEQLANKRRQSVMKGTWLQFLHAEITNHRDADEEEADIENMSEREGHLDAPSSPTGGKGHPEEVYHFHFTKYLLHRIRFHLFPSDNFMVIWTIFDRVIILVVYLVLFATIVQTPRTVAYFSLNAHSALRDLHYEQSCDDAACTSGLMRRWTWDDNLRMEHLELYAERLLKPQLFPDQTKRQVKNFAGTNATVAWDPYVTLQLPITVRQVRGRTAKCKSPVRSTINLADGDSLEFRDLLQSGIGCGDGLKFSKEPMDIPVNSVLDASAYLHSETCYEIDKGFTHGTHYHHYPCAGYSATVHNYSQLHYALSEYLDSETRFVSICINLKDARDTTGIVLQYQLLAEFSHGGSAGQFWAHTMPTIDPDIRTITYVELVLQIIDCAVGVVGLLIRTVVSLRRFGRLPHVIEMSNMRIVVFVIYLSVYLSSSDTWWGNGVCSAISIAWFTLENVFAVLFPITQFFFLRASTVNSFLALSALKVLYIIPVFGVIMTSFTLAGFAMWGSTVKEFSTLYHSFLTISQGFLGDFESEELYARNPTFAMLYTVSFLVIVIIFALNLLLAIIAGCADESREQMSVFQPIVTVARYLRRKVYFGPMMRVLMLYILDHHHDHEREPHSAETLGYVGKALVTFKRGASRNGSDVPAASPIGLSQPEHSYWTRLLAILFDYDKTYRTTHMQSGENERFPIPLECLGPSLGPFIMHEVSRCMKLDRQPETLLCSIIALIIQEHTQFKKDKPGEFAEDVEKDKNMQSQLEEHTKESLATEASDGKQRVTLKDDLASAIINAASFKRVNPLSGQGKSPKAGSPHPVRGQNANHLSMSDPGSLRGSATLASSVPALDGSWSNDAQARKQKKQGKISRIPASTLSVATPSPHHPREGEAAGKRAPSNGHHK